MRLPAASAASGLRSLRHRGGAPAPAPAPTGTTRLVLRTSLPGSEGMAKKGAPSRAEV